MLGFHRVPHPRRGIAVSRSILRMGGAGHSAGIHSSNAKTIMAFSAAVNALRVAVNSGCSTGAAGFDTTIIEEACRAIDLDGSLERAWSDMAAAGVKRGWPP